jgi:hypothetical protein
MTGDRSFQTDDLDLTLPAGFVDKSAQLLEWEVEGGTVALGIQRDCSAQRPSAAELLAKLASEYERRLPQYVPEEFPSDAISLDLEHRLLAMRWRRQGQTVFQVQAFIERIDRLLVVTVSGEARHRAFVTQLMVTVLNELSLREPDR